MTDRTLELSARWLAAAAAAVSALVLVIWFADASAVDRFTPGAGTMKVNAALSCLALAATMATRRAVAVALLCGVTAVAALVALAEWVLDVDLGIDQLLVRDEVSVGLETAGRMGPATAICLLLLAGARWSLQRDERRLAHLLLVPAVAVGALALLGHLFQVEQFYELVAYSNVAVPTAVAVLLLCGAIACGSRDGVVRWLIGDPGAGATLVRHMLPVALVVLPLLGIIPLLGLYTDVFGERFSIALMVASAATVLLVVTGIAARRLDRTDRERRNAQDNLRGLNEKLRERRDLEWRRAEELSRNLGEERAKFQRAIGKVDDLIWTVQVMPDGELRPEFTSGDASGLFGGKPDVEGGGEAIPNRVHPEDQELLEAFDDKIRAGQQAEVELRLVGYDDVVRWAWVRATPRRERNQLFADGISTNVTERRQLAERREQLLSLEQEQVRQLKQLNQLREELLAVTGHELRTPLSVILGYAELLLQEKDVTDVQRRHLEVMANRARQIALLVEDIFDLAKFSAGLATIDARPVQLHEVVTQAVQEHRATAQDAGLTIVADVTPVEIAADPVRLRQVLDNLLSNAIKYSLPGGHVAVTCRHTGDAGDTATITVSDSGIGIPEDEVEQVFDRMYRASSAKILNIKGTGLGLSVAKAMVEAHAGRISVANLPEGGTRFTVELPAQGVAPSGPEEQV